MNKHESDACMVAMQIVSILKEIDSMPIDNEATEKKFKENPGKFVKIVFPPEEENQSVEALNKKIQHLKSNSVILGMCFKEVYDRLQELKEKEKQKAKVQVKDNKDKDEEDDKNTKQIIIRMGDKIFRLGLP